MLHTRESPSDFSEENFQAKRELHNIFKVPKEKQNKTKKNTLQLRIFYPARLSFRIEGEIKSFLDKHKVKEFITNKHVLNVKDTSLGRK